MGCGYGLITHVHHLRHWINGGPTVLSNLITLCPAHHSRVHELGWKMSGDANELVTFVGPHGRQSVSESFALVVAITSDAQMRGATRGYKRVIRRPQSSHSSATQASYSAASPPAGSITSSTSESVVSASARAATVSEREGGPGVGPRRGAGWWRCDPPPREIACGRSGRGRPPWPRQARPAQDRARTPAGCGDRPTCTSASSGMADSRGAGCAGPWAGRRWCASPR